MATYLTLNSKFTPYTYEEILKPYQDRQAAYDAKMESINEMEGKTSLWEGILDPIKDKELYEAFENYKNRLSKVSSRLGNGDASAVTKAEINKLAQEYNRTFAPIELKYAELKLALKDLNELVQKAMLNGREIIPIKDVSTMSIKDTFTPGWNNPEYFDVTAYKEKMFEAGATYGKNRAYYSVFGNTLGNSAPEDLDTFAQRTVIESLPSNLDDATKLSISAIGLDALNKGMGTSHSEEIFEMLDTEAARKIQAIQANASAKNAETARYLLLAELFNENMKIENGLIVLTTPEEGEGPSVTNITPSGYDNIYTGLYYVEDSDGNRKYYKKQGDLYIQVSTEGSKVAFKQNGKVKYHDYKDNKIYVKNQDGLFVEDAIKLRSETYDDAKRKKDRDLFANNNGNILYIDMDKLREKNFEEKPRNIKESDLDNLNTIYLSNKDQIEFISAEEFMQNDPSFYDLNNIRYEYLKKAIINTGYDADLLIIIRDKGNPKKVFIALKNEPGLPPSILNNYPQLYMRANGIEAIETPLNNEDINPNDTVDWRGS